MLLQPPAVLKKNAVTNSTIILIAINNKPKNLSLFLVFITKAIENTANNKKYTKNIHEDLKKTPKSHMFTLLLMLLIYEIPPSVVRTDIVIKPNRWAVFFSTTFLLTSFSFW